MDYKYTGIILGKKDVGETDRIYTIYTQEAGKVRVLGKGVKKPEAKLAGHLEPVTLSEIFTAKSRGLGKITGSIVLENFSKIKNDYAALQKAYYAFRILDKLIGEGEKDAPIFSLISSFLAGLEKNHGQQDKMDVLTLGFLFRLFGEAGYELEVERCVSCRQKLQKENNYLSLRQGGVLCQNCQAKESNKHKISTEAIKLIRIFQKNKPESLAKLKVPAKDINNLKIIAKEAFAWISS